MKKILTIIATCIALVCLFSVFASAESDPAASILPSEDGVNIPESTTPDADSLPQEDSASSSQNTEATEEQTDKDNGKGADENAENGVFDSIYKALEQHSTQILSALSCIFCAVIVFTYKKGILPLISSGLKSISGGVSKTAEAAKQQTEDNKSLYTLIEQRLSLTEGTIDKILDSLSAIEEKTVNKKDTEKREEELREILSCQIDMLYEIFMAATMPQYEKERIGDRISQMKASLGKEG